ncbi:MAG: hypothetical protein ILP12_01710 [Lachnospiraceae bacterium]|nr:hypothetical protein [Lachnospiraceae bacterium]
MGRRNSRWLAGARITALISAAAVLALALVTVFSGLTLRFLPVIFLFGALFFAAMAVDETDRFKKNRSEALMKWFFAVAGLLLAAAVFSGVTIWSRP